MTVAFYFTLKDLIVLKIFKFFSWHFGHVEKGLDQNDKVNFKICDITAWLTNNCDIHTDQLTNILRSKGDQAMKSGQSIECNMRNIFLEKSYAKCFGGTSPRPFSEKLKLSISLDKQCKALYSLLLLYGKSRAIIIYRS